MLEQRGIVRGIRLKVLIGFGLVLLAVGLAGVINFISLNRLVASVKILAQPDEKLLYTRRLLGHLANEENSVRSYTLTQDDHYLDVYHELSDSIHYSLDQLKTVTLGNDQQSALTDSIQELVTEREGLLTQFLAKRKADMAAELKRNTVFPEKNQSSPRSKPAATTSKEMVAPATQSEADNDSSAETKRKEFLAG